LSADGAEFESVLVDLQSALRERFERLSNLALATILKMPRPKPAADASNQEASSQKEIDGKIEEKKRFGT
jgi:hypothetical protein